MQVLELLKANPHIVMDEAHESTYERVEEPPEDGETRVWGNIAAFVERLDDELFKSLQVVYGTDGCGFVLFSAEMPECSWAPRL